MNSLAILSAAAKSSTLLSSCKDFYLKCEKFDLYCVRDFMKYVLMNFGDMTWTPPEIAPVTMEAMKEATDASKPKIADTAVAIGPLIVSCCLKKE